MKYRKKQTHKLPTVRYAFPTLSCLITLVWMLIPSMRYQVGTEAPRASVSLWGLLDNTLDICRSYLFSATSEKSPENDAFAAVALTSLALCALLALLAAAASVLCLLAFCHVTREKNRQEKPGRLRRWFVTLIPNRAVLAALQALWLPLLLFPHILILLYERYLLIPTYLTYVTLSPLLLFILLYGVSIVLSILSRKGERLDGTDPFSRAAFRPPQVQKEEETTEEEEQPLSTLHRMKKESAAEQTERLRRLLGYDSEGENGEEDRK